MIIFPDTHHYADEINNYIAKHPYEAWFPNLERDIKASSMALNNEGYAFYEKKKYNDAIVKFTQAVQVDTTNSFALYNLACCYDLTEQEAAAIGSLKKAISYHPLWGIMLMVDSDLDCIRNCRVPEKEYVSYSDWYEDPYTGSYLLSQDGSAMVGSVGYRGYFCLFGDTVFIFCDFTDNPEYAEIGRAGFLYAKAIPASQFGMK